MHSRSPRARGPFAQACGQPHAGLGPAPKEPLRMQRLAGRLWRLTLPVQAAMQAQTQAGAAPVHMQLRGLTQPAWRCVSTLQASFHPSQHRLGHYGGPRAKVAPQQVLRQGGLPEQAGIRQADGQAGVAEGVECRQRLPVHLRLLPSGPRRPAVHLQARQQIGHAGRHQQMIPSAGPVRAGHAGLAFVVEQQQHGQVAGGTGLPEPAHPVESAGIGPVGRQHDRIRLCLRRPLRHRAAVVNEVHLIARFFEPLLHRLQGFAGRRGKQQHGGDTARDDRF